MSLDNPSWAKWSIPADPVTLLNSDSGDSVGSIAGVSFSSNNVDGIYLIGSMDNEGRLARSDGNRLKNPLRIKFPGMSEEVPMADGSVEGYPGVHSGYVHHKYLPGSYEGNIDLYQKIDESDLRGLYSGILSIALSYSIPEPS